MSADFDWSQFKTVSSPDGPEGFDWGQFKEVKKENKVPEMKREIGRMAKVVGSTVAGLPGDVASQIGSGLNWIAGKVPFGKPKSEEELSSLTKNPFTSESIQSGIEKIAPSLAPQSAEEKRWEDNLSLLTSLVTPIPGGKAKAADPKKLKALYQSGKNLGLSEKQLAPLFHGKVTQGILGKLAGQGKDAAQELELTRGALGSVYDSLKSRGAASIPEKAADKLESQLRHFRGSLEKTLSPSPEKQSLITFLQKAEDRLVNQGATGEELINFYQDINKSIKWNSLHGGKRQLAVARDFVKEALSQTDKSLAKDFGSANKLWEKSSEVIKSLGSKDFRKFLDFSSATTLIGALVTGNISLASKVATSYASKQGLAKISSKLLTDPNWSNLHGKMLQAIKNNSPKMAQTIMQTLKNKVEEEDPEDLQFLEEDS